MRLSFRAAPEPWRFRIAVAVLLLVGAAILFFSLRNHHVPRDEDVLPRVPPGDAPPPART